ncbi:hypothetical protein CDAR_375741 [Caerostris darwini]|uniref:Uncharacterized protein n=1 Tax=Caerostris darwini TaxID=1538125 RepID=A0AAV4S8H7_9ARAC|nr:hypothetical protein CDAR_375741 [Caerostris darwini]
MSALCMRTGGVQFTVFSGMGKGNTSWAGNFRRGEREREWPVIKCPTEQIKRGRKSDNKDGSPLSIRKQLDSLGGKAKEEEEHGWQEEIKGGGESDNKDGSPLSIRKQLDSLGGNAKEEEAWLARDLHATIVAISSSFFFNVGEEEVPLDDLVSKRCKTVQLLPRGWMLLKLRELVFKEKDGM